MNPKSLLIGWAFLWAVSGFGWTYQEFRTLIEKGAGITRVEDILERLDSELLGNYLFIHKSGSMQQASVEFPRTILFTNDGKFVMAYGGHPDFVGSNSMEMIQFNSKERKFEFYKATFPEDGQGAVVFSEKNPKECTTCHRQDLRPNWDAYPFWKNAYGSIADFDKERIDGYPEAELFKKFQAIAKSNPRYSPLLGLQHKTIAKMSNRNLDFNRAVGWRNFERLASYLAASRDFSKYQYAIVGALKKCDLETFIPTVVQRSFANDLNYYLKLATATEQAFRGERSKHVKRLETFYEPKIIGSLRYLLEGRKIPSTSWSMVFGKEDFNLSDGSHGVKTLHYLLLKQFPHLNGQDCNDLRIKSMAALNGG